MLALFEFLLSVIPCLLVGPFDRRRIKRFFEERGESVQRIRWAPFSPGWMSSPRARFYRVEYTVGNGNPQTVTCRTSWRTGVVVTDEEEDDE